MNRYYLSTRQRRNLRRRRPRPRIEWQHVLGFSLVAVPSLTWLAQLLLSR